MTNVKMSKDMIDLALKIKRHLRNQHQITISLADPALLDTLIDLPVNDDIELQSMLHYLFSLAGDNWVAKAATKRRTGKAPKGTTLKEKLSNMAKHSSRTVPRQQKHPAIKRYRGQAVAEELPPTPIDATATPAPSKKSLRYYRGQPVYE